MSVQLRRKAELFYKALEDIWSAEQLQKGSPNNAIWLCTQAAEKTMKGYLRCLNKEFGYDHNLEVLQEETNKTVKLSDETNKAILFLNAFGSTLRYKVMKTDPTPDDAKVVISRTKLILDEFSRIPDITSYINEAKEIHTKILKTVNV